mmetsp:Transcript_17130/g.69358  ORF Transcript_17130/g.69358 Transcript_17130/m.69358 type:complete len:80 (+) Transcript_17130:579-818(+)
MARDNVPDCEYVLQHPSTLFILDLVACILDEVACCCLFFYASHHLPQDLEMVRLPLSMTDACMIFEPPTSDLVRKWRSI